MFPGNRPPATPRSGFRRSRAWLRALGVSLLASASCREPRRDILGTEQNQHSQHGEELLIRDFFQDRRNGFFLDVGCAWPVIYSNTYYLEKELGWTGIGVDALPDYEKRWRKRRPKSKFFNFAVTDQSGTIVSFHRTVRRDLLGISTLKPGHHDVEYEEIQVPTITLDKLLHDNGVSKIDLLSMDIEGAELLALSGFDIDRFQPELAVVEVHGDTREPVNAYFRSHRYQRIDSYLAYDQANYYFSRNPIP